MKGLVTLERVHEDPDVLVVTSGWPRDDAPTHCVFIKRQMDSLAKLGVRYETLLIHGYKSWLAYPVAAARLAALNARPRKYRLIHAHGGEAATAACFYRRAPLVMSFLGGDLLGNSYRTDAKLSTIGRLRRWALRRTGLLATRTITKSPEMERALPDRVQRRNSVIPNGVDAQMFRPVGRGEARGQLGWNSDDRVALFVGNPGELRKRFGLAEEAVNAARRSIPDLRLVVGHGVEPQHVPVYMNASDCLVLLSWMEGSPNVVKEALMCDLPVIATPVGDVVALLQGVEPSFLVEPKVEAVARALIDGLTVPRRSNGRERSRSLREEMIAQRVLSVYESSGAQLRLRPSS